MQATSGQLETRGREEVLMRVIRELVAELHPESSLHLTLDSSLDRELGLSSLARMELLTRLERADFGANPVADVRDA